MDCCRVNEMFQGRDTNSLRNLALSVLVAGALGLTGCQQYATYPPVEVTAHMQRPEAEPVPTIIAQTVVYARERYTISADLPLNLPEHMTAATYDRVFAHLQGGQPMQHAAESALHITAVRTRGQHAQVDLVFPATSGFHESCTIELERGLFEEWRVTGARKWAFGRVQPPSPNYGATASQTAQAGSN